MDGQEGEGHLSIFAFAYTALYRHMPSQVHAKFQTHIRTPLANWK